MLPSGFLIKLSWIKLFCYIDTKNFNTATTLLCLFFLINNETMNKWKIHGTYNQGVLFNVGM